MRNAPKFFKQPDSEIIDHYFKWQQGDFGTMIGYCDGISHNEPVMFMVDVHQCKHTNLKIERAFGSISQQHFIVFGDALRSAVRITKSEFMMDAL